ncbi:hypothetical protein BDV95DRAFT_151661 [Massariosphaeria phaeospora]|uniref:Uncharacterized protein n=1 Tax=Massariosphaeria phaeospora TaxID=100035 RepID=A0A7C8MHC5_9PLEO|nr:hypothetical protein BDV95DRAFT_151661 [Massariosphaeria phaeospora]
MRFTYPARRRPLSTNPHSIKGVGRRIHRKVGQIEEKIDKLQGKRARYLHKALGLEKGPLEAASVAYSKAWTLQFATALQSRLPRELRDVIYGQLWDRAAISKVYKALGTSLTERSCPGPNCDCLKNVQVPHVVDPAYIGPQVALEVVESFYKAALSQPRNPFSVQKVCNVKHALEDDVFHVGFKPAAIYRSMTVSCGLDEYANFGPRFLLEPYVQAGFEAPRGIPNKKGFSLHVNITQRYFRLEVLRQLVDMLRPVCEEFEREGAATVRVMFRDECKSAVEKNLKDTFALSAEDWKKEMTAFLDGSPMQERHRVYRREDQPNYRPQPTYGDPEHYSRPGGSDDDSLSDYDEDETYGRWLGGPDSDYDYDMDELGDDETDSFDGLYGVY